jgi:hypothetical protein
MKMWSNIFYFLKTSLKIRDFETNILLSLLFFKFVQNVTHKRLKLHKLGHLVKSKTLHLTKGCILKLSIKFLKLGNGSYV